MTKRYVAFFSLIFVAFSIALSASFSSSRGDDTPPRGRPHPDDGGGVPLIDQRGPCTASIYNEAFSTYDFKQRRVRVNGKIESVFTWTIQDDIVWGCDNGQESSCRACFGAVTEEKGPRSTKWSVYQRIAQRAFNPIICGGTYDYSIACDVRTFDTTITYRTIFKVGTGYGRGADCGTYDENTIYSFWP